MKFDTAKVLRTLNGVKFKAEKHAPELLTGAGVATFAATVIFAVRGTFKATDALASTQEVLDDISANESEDEKSSGKIRAAKLGCAGELVTAYLPVALCGAASLSCFIGSNHISRKRLIGTAAAYATLAAGFDEYRSRVIETYGEDADRKFQYGIVNKKVKHTETDPETGKKIKVTETEATIEGCSSFGVYFKPEYEVAKTGKTVKNSNWQPNDLFNLTFIKAQCSWFNGKLDRGERVYLSEVYKALGIPMDDCPDVRVVGWLPISEGGDDAYIRFNAYQPHASDDFLINDAGEILLDFNTDGVILYK